MKIERRIVDDLKTERPDITAALPAYLRIVPVLFYAVVVGGILLSAFFLFVLRNAAVSQQQWIAETGKRNQTLADVKAERESLEKQAKRATDVVTWVEGARSLQPLVVTIIRSMDTGSSIAELDLSRDTSNATQIKLALKLNAQSPKQLDSTLEKISSMNFRSYNPNQTQSRGEIDYEATLIYQTNHASPPAPIPATTAPRAPAPPANS